MARHWLGSSRQFKDGFGVRGYATLSLPVPQILPAGFASYTGFVVVLAMLFGGGHGQGWSDVIVQLATLPLLVWALFKLATHPLGRLGRWSIALLCAIVALPLLQMIPLPPNLWSLLPGRQEIVSGFQAAGMTLPWLPISLNTSATRSDLLSLIPAIAIFIAMLSLDPPGRRIMIALVLGVAFVSVPFDLLQIMGGPASELRPYYPFTSPLSGVGFFANADHEATFLSCAAVFAAGWLIGLVRESRQIRTFRIFILLLLIPLAVAGVALTFSRAGVVLIFTGGFLCLALVKRMIHGRTGSRIFWRAIAGNLIALVIVFQFGFISLAQRTQTITDTTRWNFAKTTVQAAIANMPFGTGFGTFVPAYEMHAPRITAHYFYVNHAHNDWLELLLEGGVPALVLMLGFLAWFAAASVSAWRRGPAGIEGQDVALARAASIVIVLMLLHSLVDYPMRNIAINVLFAASCALLLDNRNASSREVMKE